MTVYFLSPMVDPERVKIGHTMDLERRLQAISSQYEQGIELLAICEGNESLEKAFHLLFEESRIEGEWFIRSPAILHAIQTFSPNVTGKRIWGRVRPTVSGAGSAIDRDRQLAFELLKQLMGKFGAVPFSVAQTKALEELFAVNPLWSRRRVRAIWDREARRIDYYEIQDLKSALEAWESDTYQAARHD